MTKLRQTSEELRDAYRYPGFVPSRTIERLVDDPSAIVLALQRREKKRPAAYVDGWRGVGTIGGSDWSGICPAAICGCCWPWMSGGSAVRRVVA